LDPRFTGTNPAESNGFLRAIKIHTMTSFEGEVKPSASCKILRDVDECYRYERDTCRQKSVAICHQVTPRFTASYNQSRELWWMNLE
jgi:hypothetical protein